MELLALVDELRETLGQSTDRVLVEHMARSGRSRGELLRLLEEYGERNPDLVEAGFLDRLKKAAKKVVKKVGRAVQRVVKRVRPKNPRATAKKATVVPAKKPRKLPTVKPGGSACRRGEKMVFGTCRPLGGSGKAIPTPKTGRRKSADAPDEKKKTSGGDEKTHVRRTSTGRKALPEPKPGEDDSHMPADWHAKKAAEHDAVVQHHDSESTRIWKGLIAKDSRDRGEEPGEEFKGFELKPGEGDEDSMKHMAAASSARQQRSYHKQMASLKPPERKAFAAKMAGKREQDAARAARQAAKDAQYSSGDEDYSVPPEQKTNPGRAVNPHGKTHVASRGSERATAA